MSISIPLNLDDGFLRRQCPNCDRQFKWHHGPVDDRPMDATDPPMYHCPYCGLTAMNDEWWTDEQAAFVQEAGLAAAIPAINEELGDTFKGVRSKYIRFDFKPAAAPIPPNPPIEPPDMVAVSSPCHPWEPIKVAEDWVDPLHCLVCGDQFST